MAYKDIDGKIQNSRIPSVRGGTSNVVYYDDAAFFNEDNPDNKMETISIGFTGNRKGFNQHQAEMFMRMLRDLREAEYCGPSAVKFHHGCCEGSDLQAAEMFREYFPEGKIIQHPPTNLSFATINENDTILPSHPYLKRNHHIVDDSDFLVAVPSEKVEQLRSGTWATIRYGRKMGKRVEVLFP